VSASPEVADAAQEEHRDQDEHGDHGAERHVLAARLGIVEVEPEQKRAQPDQEQGEDCAAKLRSTEALAEKRLRIGQDRLELDARREQGRLFRHPPDCG